MRATMSVLGLFEYDRTLFDDLSLPVIETEGGGTLALDREDLISNLVIELAELEVLYPDPEIMKSAIGFWSRKMVENWKKIFRALTQDYNPLENYDRMESFSGKSDGTQDSNTTTGTKVAGFNSEELVERGEDNTVNSVKNGYTHENEGRVHGNIGVTTSQYMLVQEVDVRRKYNMYDIIINDFKKRFCLMVY